MAKNKGVSVYRGGKLVQVSEAEADAVLAANRRKHAGSKPVRVIDVNDKVRVGGIGAIGHNSGTIIVRDGK
ncbi:hypothetical protein GCM10022237_39440 [Nocardioides ginsengisoli]|uniref:hypothetical protein n=1 Tax=Nocardioides ginsengisoli TaxID=363868 RepID=UPI0033706E4B